jgi:Uma2 family endonuclease
LLTEQEYLAIDRAADCKHEFYRGELFAMAGAKRPHNLIAANLVHDLAAQLRSGPCELYPGDMRVKVGETTLYIYPDVVVACGEIEFLDEEEDTLLNPTLVIEILSRSTEAYDRGAKFARYQQIPSPREYLLVAQDRRRIERFLRQAPGQEWRDSEVSGWEGSLRLTSIGCMLEPAQVYERVRIPASVPLHVSRSDEPR